MRFWACQRSKKPLELSSHRDRQPERGALGWNLPRQGDVSLGLATLEKAPWSLALTVTDYQSEVRRGDFTRQGDVSLGLATLEKALELSSHPD